MDDTFELRGRIGKGGLLEILVPADQLPADHPYRQDGVEFISIGVYAVVKR